MIKDAIIGARTLLFFTVSRLLGYPIFDPFFSVHTTSSPRFRRDFYNSACAVLRYHYHKKLGGFMDALFYTVCM